MAKAKDPNRCQKMIWDQWRSRQCRRSVWKDGYCKQHHPDTVAARTEQKIQEAAAKAAHSPYTRLARAEERVAKLESDKRILQLKIITLEAKVEELETELTGSEQNLIQERHYSETLEEEANRLCDCEA